MVQHSGSQPPHLANLMVLTVWLASLPVTQHNSHCCSCYAVMSTESAYQLSVTVPVQLIMKTTRNRLALPFLTRDVSDVYVFIAGANRRKDRIYIVRLSTKVTI